MARFDIESLEAAGAAGGADSAAVFFQLGLLYCTGRDMETDLVLAHKWFNLAALNGNDEAKQARVELAEQMSAEEIADALRQARSWMTMH